MIFSRKIWSLCRKGLRIAPHTPLVLYVLLSLCGRSLLECSHLVAKLGCLLLMRWQNSLRILILDKAVRSALLVCELFAQRFSQFDPFMPICASNHHWTRSDLLPLGGRFQQCHRFDLIYRLCIDKTLVVRFKSGQDRLFICLSEWGLILRKHKRVETVIISTLFFVYQRHSFARIIIIHDEGFSRWPSHSHLTFCFA